MLWFTDAPAAVSMYETISCVWLKESFLLLVLVLRGNKYLLVATHCGAIAKWHHGLLLK